MLKTNYTVAPPSIPPLKKNMSGNTLTQITKPTRIDAKSIFRYLKVKKSAAATMISCIIAGNKTFSRSATSAFSITPSNAIAAPARIMTRNNLSRSSTFTHTIHERMVHKCLRKKQRMSMTTEIYLM